MKLTSKISEKIVENPKQQLKTYSFLSLLANILIAVAYGLSLAFGMGMVNLSPVYIILAMGFVATLGGVGKFIKQRLGRDEDDAEHN